MRRTSVLILGIVLATTVTACNVRVFISDTRLRGPVPSATEVAAARATTVATFGTPTPTPSVAEQSDIRALVRELSGLVGKDLSVVAGFSGRETPNSGARRGMRVDPGDFIRVSAGRSQEVAMGAGEYCVAEHCSRVWVHGRPGGGSLGAWYPLVIFEYPPTE